MRRWLAVLLFASSLTACASPTPARRDVVIGLLGEPASVFADEPGARVIAAAVTEPLVALDARGEFVARLASDVPTVQNGGLTVVTDDPTAPGGRLIATFRLRDGLHWQDGEPLTALDVAFAHELDAKSAIGTQERWTADRVESVEVLDDQRVRVSYRANERWTSYPLAPRVLPRHLLANADAAKRAAYAREPVHAGAFSVAAWVPGYGVTLAAFPGHVGGAPALGRLEIRFFPDRDAILDALRRGLIDVAPSPAIEADLGRTLDRFADANRLEIYYKDAEALEVLRFSNRGPFAEHAVRKAVELAVDRARIVETVFAGRARVPRSYLVPPLWAAAESGSIVRPDRDGARALLAQAGFHPGSFGILERDVQRLSVTLLVASGSDGRLDSARAVAADLGAIGIAADVRARPPSEVATAIAKGDFDLALASEQADDPTRATERWLGLVDPWFDVLAAAAWRAQGQEEKRALYAELQRIWSDALPGLPLYQRLRVDIAARALTGVQAPPQEAALTWNAAEWRFATP
ncbi:MAG TPA: ABC transporter substrate-binding protein [Candidatus Limnocylindrales bacterium]|nr:ABC transporter substrate-binding protein [Candidatus Limnocylindrales bacterium]